MSGDENTGTIVVDRPSATAGIAAIRAQQAQITDAGSEGAGLFDKVTKALGITVPGQGAVEVPTGGADTVRQQAEALSRRTGAVADGLEKWMNTELEIQTRGAQAVRAAGDGSGKDAPAPPASKPADPAPAAETPKPEVKPETAPSPTATAAPSAPITAAPPP
jgi:hypothetical protein